LQWGKQRGGGTGRGLLLLGLLGLGQLLLVVVVVVSQVQQSGGSRQQMQQLLYLLQQQSLQWQEALPV
jgi:hypothetical protein